MTKVFQEHFQKFNSENLAFAIHHAFMYLFKDDERLREELERYVFPRLSFMAQDDKAERFFSV